MAITSIFCFFFKETTTPEYELEYSENTFAAETEQEVDSYTLTGEDPVAPAITDHTDPHLLKSLNSPFLSEGSDHPVSDNREDVPEPRLSPEPAEREYAPPDPPQTAQKGRAGHPQEQQPQVRANTIKKKQVLWN